MFGFVPTHLPLQQRNVKLTTRYLENIDISLILISELIVFIWKYDFMSLEKFECVVEKNLS